MEITQILWGVNTFLLGVLGVIGKGIWDDLKDQKQEIQKRTLIITCDKIHEQLAKELHVHGSFGMAGEVIKK